MVYMNQPIDILLETVVEEHQSSCKMGHPLESCDRPVVACDLLSEEPTCLHHCSERIRRDYWQTTWQATPARFIYLNLP